MACITLESVEEAFFAWRTQRSSRAELIPKNLWSMALWLYPQYKRSINCHRLRLSGSQFKQRLESTGDTFADNGFVYASRDEDKATSVPNPDVQLTIQGKKRSLTLCFGVHTLGQILPHVSVLL
jgi:hypothetical protein